eukprot:gene26061-34062_t
MDGKSANLVEELATLKEIYPSMNFSVSDGIIVAIVNDFKYSVWDSTTNKINKKALDSCDRMNTYYQRRADLIKNGYLGNYCVITSNPLRVRICQTEGFALDLKEEAQGDAFVCCIGDEDYSGYEFMETTVHCIPKSLVEREQMTVDRETGLRFSEMPVDYHDSQDTNVPEVMISYFSKVAFRRWIKVSAKLKSNKYRFMWFLLDTGAPRSFIHIKFRNGFAEEIRNIKDKDGNDRVQVVFPTVIL